MAKFVGNNDKGSDSRFFTTQKKGEMHELRMELHSTDRNVKVDAVKKVIASMTVGKDVSMLFTDVLNCVQVRKWSQSELSIRQRNLSDVLTIIPPLIYSSTLSDWKH
jgi:hypothetical protein